MDGGKLPRFRKQISRPASNILQWYFSLTVFSAIRIRLKQDELSGKVARATERLVKGICGEKNAAPRTLRALTPQLPTATAA